MYETLHAFSRRAIAPVALVLSGAATAQLAPPAIPSRIVPNFGQWGSPELYRVHIGGMQVHLEARGWSFWLREPREALRPGGAAKPPHGCEDPAPPRRAVSVRMRFAGADRPIVRPERPLPGVSHFLLGEPASHRRDVPGYGAVLYEEMYPGVDVRLRDAGGRLEYDTLLAPRADLAQVELVVDGAESLRIDDSGALVLQTALGEVRQPGPTTWMLTATGERKPVACRYELRGERRFGFAVPERDPELALVIDPPLLYGSFIGGSAWDEPSAVAEISNGWIAVAGYTESLDFPTSPGAIQAVHGGATGDGYLMVIDPAQPPASQYVFATYFGGNAWDYVADIVELPGGLIAFAGSTQSNNLPTTAGAYQAAHAGSNDGFIGFFDPTGTVLIALTYFGTGSLEWINSLHPAPNGQICVVGSTDSQSLPVTANAFSATHSGGTNIRDGYVAVFDALLTMTSYVTYFGGSGDEFLSGAGVDQNGVITVYGGTDSADWPTANAFDPTPNGGGAFWWSTETAVAQIDPGLPPAQQLVYGSYLGGSGEDWPYDGVLAPNGGIVVSGVTTSTNFPTTPGAYQGGFAGGGNTVNFLAGDGFITKLDPSQSGAAGLAASTYCGGSYWDQGLGCEVDSNGELTLVGWTNVNSSMPTTPNAMRRTYAGNDGFVARFSADARQLLYGSLLGGTDSYDGAWNVGRQADGIVSVTGGTASLTLPTINAVQPVYGGSDDAWLQRIDMIPDGTMRYGSPTPGINGYPTIHAIGDATPGNVQFGLACSRAPASMLGAIVFAWGAGSGAPLFGADLWVDQFQVAASSFVFADSAGEHSWTLALPSYAIPSLYVQYIWLEATSPLALSATDALQIN